MEAAALVRRGRLLRMLGSRVRGPGMIKDMVQI